MQTIHCPAPNGKKGLKRQNIQRCQESIEIYLKLINVQDSSYLEKWETVSFTTELS